MWEQIQKSINKSFRVVIETVKETVFIKIVEASRKGHFTLTDDQLRVMQLVVNAAIDDAISKSYNQITSAITSVKKETEKGTK